MLTKKLVVLIFYISFISFQYLFEIYFSHIFGIISQAYRCILQEKIYYWITRILRLFLRSIWIFFNVLRHSDFSTFSKKFSCSNFEPDLSDIRMFWGQTSRLFHIEKLTFMFSSYFKNFRNCHFVHFSAKKKTTNNFRKSFCIFRKANNYSNKDYKSYVLPAKCLWTDLFLRWYFDLEVISDWKRKNQKRWFFQVEQSSFSISFDLSIWSINSLPCS